MSRRPRRAALRPRWVGKAEEDRWECDDVVFEQVEGRRVLNIFLESPTAMPHERLEKIRTIAGESFDDAPTITFITSTKLGE